jgi:hypothetical protein
MPDGIDEILAKFPGPVMLYRSRGKWLLILAVCIVFVASGVVMITGGLALGWLVAAFFGFGIVISGLMLLPGSGSLKLERDGFETTSLRRRFRTRWADTDGFAAIALPIPHTFQKLVAYDDVKAVGGDLAEANTAMIGRNAALPDTYGLSADDLASLMMRWRARAMVL